MGDLAEVPSRHIDVGPDSCSILHMNYKTDGTDYVNPC
jgi:hypothetical protein